MRNRAGYEKTNLSGEMAYQSFVPSALPPVPPIEMSEEMIRLQINANKQHTEQESAADRKPNME